MCDLISDPNYLAYRLNFNNETIEFLQINQSEMRKVAWLKHENIDAKRKLESIPLAEVYNHLSGRSESTLNFTDTATSPLFIFHTAYCASTYLSRCLDVEGVSLSLREPQILLDAANAKRLNWRSQTTSLTAQDLPALAMQLLSKHGHKNQRLIIKPINSVNNIIPELLTAVPAARAILLYTDARSFALSALKKGESARQTLRAMFDLLRCDFPHLDKLRISDAIHMSDLKLILTLWRLQIEQANAALKQYQGKAKLASLYSETLIANPGQVMSSVDQFLGLGLGEKRVAAIVNSDASRRDAKEPSKGFSLGERQATYAKLEEFFGTDLRNGLQWLASNNPKTGLQPELVEALSLN